MSEIESEKSYTSGRSKNAVGCNVGIGLAMFLAIAGEVYFSPATVSDAPKSDETDKMLGQAEIDEPIIYTTNNALLLIDQDRDSLGPLRSLLSNAEWSIPQGEYETTIEYQDRLRRFNQPIGEYSAETRFVIIANATSRFDADLNKLTFSVSVGEMGAITMDVSGGGPAVVLESSSSEGGSYVAENAFGVKRAVNRRFDVQTLLIPLAKLSGPNGCDFLNGASGSDRSDRLVDEERYIKWACGRTYVDKSKLENLSTFVLSIERPVAKELSKQTPKVAYVVSFDHHPIDGPPLYGPMEYSRSQPTLDSPSEHRTVGYTLVARLHRIVVFTVGDRIVSERVFE